MKKQLLSILLCAGLFQSLSAQVYKKGNMTLYAGTGYRNSVAIILKDVGDGTSDSEGPILLGYQYHLTDKLMIGLSYSLQAASTGKVKTETATDNVVYRTNMVLSCFMSQLNYTWYSHEKQSFILYSGASIGTFSVNKSLEIISGNKDLATAYSNISDEMAYHFTAFGFKGRFSKDSKLGAFAELGYGANGLFNAGINFSFN